MTELGIGSGMGEGAGEEAPAGPRHLWDEPDVIGPGDEGYPDYDRDVARPPSPLTLAAEAAAAAAGVHDGSSASIAASASASRHHNHHQPPPGAGPVGGRNVPSQYQYQSQARLSADDTWYARNRPAGKMAVKGQVEADIQNMLLSSREIAGRLRPPPVARKTTINFLATPKMPRGALDNYDGTDPVEWSAWKKQEMAREVGRCKLNPGHRAWFPRLVSVPGFRA